MRTVRRGTTIVELAVVLSMLAALALLALGSGIPLLDAAAVETAGREASGLFALAREHALAANQRTVVRIDTAAARIAVYTGTDTLARADFAASGVRLESTRDSMAYHASGLGVGAANLRLVLRRRARADTITVSRLGRVERR
jgi:type II secretory pathway pseudopilin PulG